MTDENNPKGWPVVFKDRRGLYGALTAIFEATTVQGSPGGLRRMYSDFLVEAADVLDNPRLEEPAERYAALAHQWDELADEALPDTVPQFQRTKQVLRERHDARLTGGEAWQATRPLTEELDAIGSECDLTFPLGDREVMDLFSGLQARLLAIHRAEVQAVESLKESAA
jgi:AcrR family transcriptional regulator